MRTPEAIARYADAVHAAIGPAHHVASPLGAWLVLALAAAAAAQGTRRALEGVLGMPADEARRVARDLLAHPHPLVSAAAAAWSRAGLTTPALAAWRAALPPEVETGDVPGQAAADAWARNRTDGLLPAFPLVVDEDTLLVLASALATRVSWEAPFELAPASELGVQSPWAARLTTVLRMPRFGHHAWIASTPSGGEVGVHLASADGGLDVYSVIAHPSVPAGLVLRAAHEVATGEAGRRSLFDLPLGEGSAWSIEETPVQTRDGSGREERYTAVLPAWSATSDHDLTADAALGFGEAAEALASLLPPDPRGFGVAARQSAVARYGRVGFEAAAVTAIGVVATAMPPKLRSGVRRTAHLRLGRAYAAVAVARSSSPWDGLPVFSAWVADPEDATGGD